MVKSLKKKILKEMVVEEPPVRVVIKSRYRGVPRTLNLMWNFDDSFLCGLSLEDAERLARLILELRPKTGAKALCTPPTTEVVGIRAGDIL